MKLPGFLSELFHPAEMQDIKIDELSFAFSDASVRAHWLKEIFSEIKNINMGIDFDLMQKKESDLKEKSARRRAIQFVLEQVLVSKRAVESQQRHNLLVKKGDGFAAFNK